MASQASLDAYMAERARLIVSDRALRRDNARIATASEDCVEFTECLLDKLLPHRARFRTVPSILIHIFFEM